MRFPPVKALTTAVSKAANANLNLAVVEAPKHWNTFKEDVIYKKIGDINRWYTRIIGLDEVKLYQDRVFDLQHRLLSAQEKRREIGVVLSEIRKKSNELQDQIHKVKRQDDLQKFLDLMREETEVLKQERDITELFTNCDREEREIFSAFTNAIRDSHEKQRAQLEYTKYLGLILSIAGSFLAFMYSSLKKNDLKHCIEENLRNMQPEQVTANLSVSLLRNIESNQKRQEATMESIIRNHQQLMHVVNKRNIPFVPDRTIMSGKPMNLNEMPDGEKLLWFSVISLVGLMILKKLFN